MQVPLPLWSRQCGLQETYCLQKTTWCRRLWSSSRLGWQKNHNQPSIRHSYCLWIVHIQYPSSKKPHRWSFGIQYLEQNHSLLLKVDLSSNMGLENHFMAYLLVILPAFIHIHCKQLYYAATATYSMSRFSLQLTWSFRFANISLVVLNKRDWRNWQTH